MRSPKDQLKKANKARLDNRWGCSVGQTPSLPVPRPANDATREKQIPSRKIP
jgi:hypothetical protein